MTSDRLRASVRRRVGCFACQDSAQGRWPLSDARRGLWMIGIMGNGNLFRLQNALFALTPRAQTGTLTDTQRMED